MPVPTEASDYAIEDVAVGQLQSTKALPAVPGHPFIYFHHADNYEIGPIGDGKMAWLPELQELPVAPGINGCRTLRRGEAPEEAYRIMIDIMRRRGMVHLPPDVDVDGEGGAYVRRIRCQHPRTKTEGYVYVDRWSIPKRTKAGKRPKFRRDQEAYNRWRLSLVTRGWVTASGETGRIMPPDPELIAEKIGIVEGHRDRHITETSSLPEDARAKIIGIAEAQLERASGAMLPRYEPDSAPVDVDHSALVIRLLAQQITNGAAAADVFGGADIDPDSSLAAEVLAAVKVQTPKRKAKR